jgi:hypothetical protein
MANRAPIQSLANRWQKTLAREVKRMNLGRNLVGGDGLEPPTLSV